MAGKEKKNTPNPPRPRRRFGWRIGLALVTLLALYVGFRLFGLPGMILSPMVAVTVTQLLKLKTDG